MSLFDRVVRDHSFGGMIAYAGEWNEEVLGYEESSGKSNPDIFMRLVSCAYQLTIYGCTMPMFTLWQVTLRDTSME